MAKPLSILTKDRADLSQFLVHLTRNGSYEVYTDLGNNRYTWKNSDIIKADDSLKRILTNQPNPSIEARSPLGYFKFKIDTRWKNRGGVSPKWIKCVCFSEAPLLELKHFYKATVRKRNEYKKYGLAFWSHTIRARGGNPIFYVDTKKQHLMSGLDIMARPSHIIQFAPLMPFMELFGPPLYRSAVDEIDFRWEREWRVPGNLSFQLKEVAFGICPENQIPEFEKLVSNTFPFIDPDWTVEQLRDHFEKGGFVQLVEAI
ncbi:MAG: hypothetical protein HY537_12710 [Deltaproteobacteria bacterium]|nr:hypothetical protein [Deltaproteobacteria bacterium]